MTVVGFQIGDEVIVKGLAAKFSREKLIGTIVKTDADIFPEGYYPVSLALKRNEFSIIYIHENDLERKRIHMGCPTCVCKPPTSAPFPANGVDFDDDDEDET